MSLTLVIERELREAGLVKFYDGNSAPWEKLAAETYDYVKSHFPAGAKIRRDDVAGALIAYLTPDESLTDFLKTEKLSQKYWYQRFSDLIIDRTWERISAPPKEKK